MKGREKLILMCVIVFAVLGGVWMFVVSPERQKAGSLNEQLATAKTELTTAEGELSKARAAQAQYGASYASLVDLGKAVPASDEVPSLLYEVAEASEHKNVVFNAIGSPATASASAAASAAAAGFSAMPFTFKFTGTFFNLERLVHNLSGMATISPSGKVIANGRLLSIQGISLSAGSEGKGSEPENKPGAKTAKNAEQKLEGSVSATAYVLPAGQSVTAGASPAAPAGAAATPASSTPAASSAAPAPATVTVNP
jgi:Tfp pilus assembly protein PilO